MRPTLAGRLLPIDALGGLAVGAIVLLGHDLLAPWYGLPQSVVLGLGAANLLYGCCSGALALTPRWRHPTAITALSLANVAWGVVAWGLFVRHRETATWVGLASLAAEGTYVPLLGLVEWVQRREIAATADARGPQWAWLECRVPPPVVALVTAAAMHMLARTWPGGLPAAWRPVGVATAVSGVALALWAILSFRRAVTTIHPTRPHEASTLVVLGPNRWSRNPMYVGLLLVLVGWGVWLGSAAAFVVVPFAWGWLRRFQVLPEERALAVRFGAAYGTYASRVRRWL